MCRYGLEVDIYAFGVLMWEVASLKVSSSPHVALRASITLVRV
jgi:hypothetical protein